MGGQVCKRCGAPMVDAADRSAREHLEGVGISIRALYAARTAMVLFWAGFFFGAMFSMGFVRQAFGAETLLGQCVWAVSALAAWAIVWGGFWKIGSLHYKRVLVSNKLATGLTGAEHDFFDGEHDHST